PCGLLRSSRRPHLRRRAPALFGSRHARQAKPARRRHHVVAHGDGAHEAALVSAADLVLLQLAFTGTVSVDITSRLSAREREELSWIQTGGRLCCEWHLLFAPA